MIRFSMFNWVGTFRLVLQLHGSLVLSPSRRRRNVFFFLPAFLYQSVRVSRSRSLLLILSHSCGGRDENDCLIMQRGQPIKGPGAE